MSIPSLGLVDINHVFYDTSTNSLTWTDGEGGLSKIHTLKGERMVAVVPCPEDSKLMSYIWLDDSPYYSSSSSVPDKQQQQQPEYVLKRFEAAGECPASLRQFIVIGSPPSHLYPAKSPDHNNLHIIISTLSGTHKASAFYTTLLKPLLTTLHLTEHHDYTTHTTSSPDTITNLTQTIFRPRAQRGIKQTIILLAGDGGLIELVKSLTAVAECVVEHEGHVFVPPVVALVPMGTGNATAYSAGIVSERDATVGLRGLLGGVPRRLPMFRVRFSRGAEYVTDVGRGRKPVFVPGDGGGGGGGEGDIYGAVVLSWGMHASLVGDSDTPEYRRFGRERFQMAAKELLFPADGSAPHVYRGRVSVTTKTTDPVSGGEMLRTRVLERSEHMYILVTLCSMLEKGFTISPASRPLDGRLWFVHFGPLASDTVMEVMQLAYDGGRHVVEKGDVVGYEEVEAVRVDFCEGEKEERWRRICIDGIIVVVEDGGWVEVRKGEREVVRLVVPEGKGIVSDDNGEKRHIN
ncbi:hypothetical protein EMCG_04288 [[Emmonsia] crescens]|uniref:DAGKc domain-containing protein n=1 Tax=[Emmonsia] crescens TaxID=73230 RepID=A0A0G2HSJ4_9EURO|nr:hypothetical protein EMCG_04288 [Emmonsia crescens UAMH 3008]